MAYFYVKDDGSAESGTATGDGGRYTSQKTGDWSTAFSATTQYYASIGAACAATTPPASGDFILISDLHNKTYDNLSSPQINGNIQLISVDDTNCDQYKPGAKENLSDTADDYLINLNDARVLFAGLDLETGDNVIELSASKTGLYACLIDCTIRIDSTTDIGIACGTNSPTVRLVNVDFLTAHESALPISTGNDAHIEWYGGSIGGSTPADYIMSIGARGVTAKIVGVDLSSTQYIASVADTDNKVQIELQNCKLKTTFSMPTLAYESQQISIFNCDDSTAGDYHRFAVKKYTGEVKNNDSIYVTATEAWYEGTDKSSIEVTTTSNCSHVRPFVFELPAQYVDLGSTSTDKIELDLITTHATAALDLTNTDIAVFLCYPDSATQVTANWLSSGKRDIAAGNYGTDPLAAGTALSNTGGLGASDWTGETGDVNYYRISIDTSTDAGEATLVQPRIEIYNSSIDGTNHRMFIHPILTVTT